MKDENAISSHLFTAEYGGGWVRQLLYHYLSCHRRMNAAMIGKGPRNRERFGEAGACTNVSTVKTIVIGCNSMCHIVVVIPGDRGPWRHGD